LGLGLRLRLLSATLLLLLGRAYLFVLVDLVFGLGELFEDLLLLSGHCLWNQDVKNYVVIALLRLVRRELADSLVNINIAPRQNTLPLSRIFSPSYVPGGTLMLSSP